MSTIDLLIKNNQDEFKLSDLGLRVKDIDETPPELDVGFRSVTNRSGRIQTNSRFGVKKIKVIGDFYVDSLFDYEELKDMLNGKMMQKESYYITKMLPINEGLYNFELPGETTEDLDLLNREQEEYKYRYRVFLMNQNFYFEGRSKKGLLFEFEMFFETADLPFGETEAKNITVTNQIVYNGTASNSQLESPWFVQLTATENQEGDFYYKIGTRTFRHESLTEIKSGDVFELSGVETRLNDSNINEYTNYEHFVLEKGNNTIETNFIGTNKIIGLKEFYK